MSKKTSDITRLFCSYNNLEQLNSCYVKLAIGVPALTMTQNLSFIDVIGTQMIMPKITNY